MTAQVTHESCFPSTNVDIFHFPRDSAIMVLIALDDT